MHQLHAHADGPGRLTGVNPAPNEIRRFELTLRKPWPGWVPKPTVVVNGTAQPTQWGTRNWKVPGTDPADVTIFLFNRMWRFGEVAFTVGPGDGQQFRYSAPWLPFGPGKVREHH